MSVRYDVAFAAGAGLLVGSGAGAEDFPVRPIRIVVAQAPASGPDLVARALGQKLSDAWRQPVIVDNRPGANGIVGGEAVARAKPDGYTLLMGVPSAITMNPFVYKKLPYDPLRDLAAVTQTATNTFGLVVTPSLPATSVKGLVALARARPGDLIYGSAGTGNQTHLAAELFAAAAGVKMLHVPYKGATPAWTDLMSGHIALMFTSTQGVAPHVTTGKLRMLATCGPTRASAFPSIPTVIESGYPGIEITGWTGLLAPAGTLPEIAAKLQTEVARILAMPEIRQAMASQGADPVGSTPEQFASFIKSEAAKWARVIRSAGLESSQ